VAIVTISRGSFSGGVAVAEAVAERLDVPCISREVVREAAQASGVPEGSLAATLEEPPRFWEKTPGRIPAHLNLVRTALLKRARGGDFVYHGYAGHLLLSGIAHVLRVRVIAGEAYRVQTAMTDLDMNEKDAAQYVRTLNTQLRKWTKFLYGVDWQDPSLYDVVLRVDRVGVAGAADTVASMTRLPPFMPTEESRKAFADLLLSSEVWAALTADARTRSASVRVAADGGDVFITGSADSARALHAISQVAEGVPGVAHVDNAVGVGGHWQW
jgi:osmotically-inducible protein OsmY